MNSKPNNFNITINQVLEQIDNYVGTIQAIQSFISIVTWDNINQKELTEARYSIGRKMDTSSTNPIAPNAHVTPDIVIQKNPNLGYTVEAKKSLDIDRSNWEDLIIRIQKYDDDLEGWWTENSKILQSCVVLLLHQSRTVAFEKFFIKHINENGISISHPFSIIEFNRSDEFRPFIFLRRTQLSNIEDQALSNRLEEGVPVPIEDVVESYGTLKFYDAPPVTEHIMAILWNDIFTELKTYAVFDGSLGAYPILIEIDDVTNELQKLYGSVGNEHREAAYPRIRWVREALEAFVSLGLAEYKGNGKFLIVKLLRQEIISYFYKHRKISKIKKNSDKSIQLTYLDNLEEKSSQ